MLFKSGQMLKELSQTANKRSQSDLQKLFAKFITELPQDKQLIEQEVGISKFMQLAGIVALQSGNIRFGPKEVKGISFRIIQAFESESLPEMGSTDWIL
jgi:hypothetical protein